MLTEGTPVTLEEMLRAREERVRRQEELLGQHKGALICFTLNIAGEVKCFPQAQLTFDEGVEELEGQLSGKGWNVSSGPLRFIENTGIEAIWALQTDPFALKRMTVAVEEGHPLGRFMDIDVICPDGQKVSRLDLNLPERGCMICGAPGPGCARSRAHPLEEIVQYTHDTMRDYFARRFADRVAQCAQRALLYEVCITPKPGLVDRANNGAHKDMNIFTFVDSASALAPYFRDIVRAGMHLQDVAPERLLAHLRVLGQRAEREMFAATRGVNTHKGLIFSLGILCAALGHRYNSGQGHDVQAVLQLCGRIACAAGEDLSKVNAAGASTNGEVLYARHSITGVRGEAAAGFPSVWQWGLPALQGALAQGASINDAGVVALLYLMAHVQDTNIISRASLQELEQLQREIGQLLKVHGEDTAQLVCRAQELDVQLMERNISPGGCADLLAITLMLHFWTCAS